MEPPQVHVSQGGASAKVWLGPVRIEYAYGFNPAEVQRLRRLLVEPEAFLLERWDEFFGR